MCICHIEIRNRNTPTTSHEDAHGPRCGRRARRRFRGSISNQGVLYATPVPALRDRLRRDRAHPVRLRRWRLLDATAFEHPLRRFRRGLQLRHGDRLWQRLRQRSRVRHWRREGHRRRRRHHGQRHLLAGGRHERRRDGVGQQQRESPRGRRDPRAPARARRRRQLRPGRHDHGDGSNDPADRFHRLQRSPRLRQRGDLAVHRGHRPIGPDRDNRLGQQRDTRQLRDRARLPVRQRCVQWQRQRRRHAGFGG